MTFKCFQDRWFREWYVKKDQLLNSRTVEYTWVSRHLNLDVGSVLDVGCGASWYPLLLASQGFEVVAIDSHNFDYGFPHYRFVQCDAAYFKSDVLFNRVLLISSLEHFGVQQHTGDDLKDFEVVWNLTKYLEDDGLWIVTLPYGQKRVLPSWRVYDQERIELLFPNIVKQESFMLEDNLWFKVSNEEAGKTLHSKGADETEAITCLVVKK